MSHRLLHKFQNKSVQQIVQELMYDEYLERDRVDLRINHKIAKGVQRLQHVKKCLQFVSFEGCEEKNSISKEYNQHITIIQFAYLIELPMQNYWSSGFIKEKAPGGEQRRVSKQVTYFSPKNVKKASKPKELRGLSISISDHMDNLMREKSILPRIQRQTQKSSAFNDDDFEGYRLQSEEMSLEIDEYMRMKRDKDSFQLPNIYSRNQ